MFHMPNLVEWLVIGGVALLLFGKRLPEMGKSMGGFIVEFKKGLHGVQDDVNNAGTPVSGKPMSSVPTIEPAPGQQARVSGDAAPSLPAEYKFDPYTGKPLTETKFDPYTGKPVSEGKQTSNA